MAALTRTVLTKENCPGAPEELLRAFNDFTQQVVSAMSGGLSQENMNSFTVTVELSPEALPFRLANKLRGARAPSAVLVARARDITAQGKPPVSIGAVGWGIAGDQILVNTLSGMTAGTSYSVTLLVQG